MKLNYNDSETQSKDLTTENIEQLKKLFPNIVEEGKVNFDVLRQLLGDEVVSEQEYYRFTWPGKHQARQEALKSSTGTLRPAKEESVDWDNTKNLYIEGDNLEVLKLLQKSYFNKVKMIYIDPPYNTGKDFVYKDNYKDNLAEYNEKFNRTDAEGNVLSSETNNEGNARYHSNWLNMMYPRLQLARTLLKDDGVIFISIDDNEVHNLRRICDEIFGEENFVAQICHKSRASISNDKIISSNHNIILFYAKNENIIFNNRKEIGLRPKLEGFNKTDEVGDYKLVPVDGPGGAKKGNPYYTFEGVTGYWRFSEKRMKEMFDNGLIVKTNNNLQQKYYKEDAKKTKRTVTTWWDDKLYSSTATIRLKKLLDSNIFDTPKPVKLIHRIIEMSNSSNSIVLDFFAGSSTTAHAVMELNKEELLEVKDSSTSSEQVGNRKYIMVQLPEPTDEKSEAFKAGYNTISEIGKERIRRAANQIKEELKDQAEVLEQLDLGFKVFKLDSSNIHTWDTAPEELENNLFRDEVIKDDRTAEDVLYEVLLKYGLDLTYPIEEVTLDNKKVYSVGAGQLIFCLDDGITRNTAQAIIDWAKEDEIIDPKVVFKDAGFTNDVEKTNLIQLFKTHGVEDVKSV